MRVLTSARHIGWTIKNLVYLAIGKYKFEYGKFRLSENLTHRFLELAYNKHYPARVRNNSDPSMYDGMISVDKEHPDTYNISMFKGGCTTFRIEDIVELHYKCLIDSQGNIVSWRG